MRRETATELQSLWRALHDEEVPRPTLALFRLVAESRLPDDPEAITAVDTGGGDRLALVLADEGLFVLRAFQIDENEPEIECRRIQLDPSTTRVSVAESWGPNRNSHAVQVRNWVLDFDREDKLEFTTRTLSDDEGDPEGFANKLAGALGWRV